MVKRQFSSVFLSSPTQSATGLLEDIGEETTGYAVCSNEILLPCGDRLQWQASNGVYNLEHTYEILDRRVNLDCLVVKSDCTGLNQPVCINNINIPTVLVLGDTHHGNTPISFLLRYAAKETYDVYCTDHDRQHLHWFEELGIGPLIWTPFLFMKEVAVPEYSQRALSGVFVGGATSRWHPVRGPMLSACRERLNLFSITSLTVSPSVMYAQALVSLNVSMNGDLNLRVAEVMSANGCLLTDKISKQSGLDVLFGNRDLFYDYDSLEDLVDKFEYLLANPQLCIQTAKRAGHYCQKVFSLEQRRTSFYQSVMEGRGCGLFDLPCDPRGKAMGPFHAPSFWSRVRHYEWLQELHLQGESLSIGFPHGVNLKSACDLVDLPRHKIYVEDNTADILYHADVREQIYCLTPDIRVEVLFISTSNSLLLPAYLTYLVVYDLTYCNPALSAIWIEALGTHGWLRVEGYPDIFKRTK